MMASPSLPAKLNAAPMPVSRWTRLRQRHRHAFEAWLILTPVLLYYLVFAVFPVLVNVALSFTRWNGISGGPVWVGLDNYVRYFQPPYPQIMFNTLLFVVVGLLLGTVVAFFIALLLNEKVYGLGLYRTLWYIPTLTSAAIMAQIITIFIAPYGGVLNNILQSIGLQPLVLTIDSTAMRAVIILFTLWRGVGGGVLLFLAGLQGVHPELYEAAAMDGATGWAKLRSITLPLLRPMIAFVLVTGTIGWFQIFEAVLLISKGGPSNQTNVMLLQIYNDAFINADFGLASAGATVMALMLLGCSLFTLRSTRQEH
ncbi:MAG: sugar ABC transporter permease [Roseiflexaceae bacterium]|nr:sugar ABC transporter permease [Roseiflexaceae bacterium]